MTRFLLAGAAALGMMTGAALADQSTTSETTTTTTPTYSGPVTVSTSVTKGQELRSDGDKTVSAGAGSKDNFGNTSETTVTNQTYPLTNMRSQIRKTTSVNNGVATETVTTTNVYPAPDTRPPTTWTTTRTYAVGGK